jgi:hypothetical protein
MEIENYSSRYCRDLPHGARRPLPAECRPKFISVTGWGARFWERSTIPNEPWDRWRLRIIAVLRYVDLCSDLPHGARRPLAATGAAPSNRTCERCAPALAPSRLRVSRSDARGVTVLLVKGRSYAQPDPRAFADAILRPRIVSSLRIAARWRVGQLDTPDKGAPDQNGASVRVAILAHPSSEICRGLCCAPPIGMGNAHKGRRLRLMVPWAAFSAVTISSTANSSVRSASLSSRWISLTANQYGCRADCSRPII